MKALVFENYQNKFNQLNKYLNYKQVGFKSIKFKNGEGKIVIDEPLNGEDVIIFSDFSNSTIYKYMGKSRRYSKDEYSVELKRLISAASGSNSITLFLPLIYQSRQNANNDWESKDYVLFINELKNLGVNRIITFELHGDDEYVDSFSLAQLFENDKYNVVVSPDNGGINRSKEYSKVLKCDDTYFSKKRDLSIFIDGINPINEYTNSNYDFTNKNVLIVDDILDSGKTLINAIKNINGANKIDVFVAYPLFSKGVKEFKKLVKDNKLNKIYISDLIYVSNRLLKHKFIEKIDTNEYVSKVIGGAIK